MKRPGLGLRGGAQAGEQLVAAIPRAAGALEGSAQGREPGVGAEEALVQPLGGGVRGRIVGDRPPHQELAQQDVAAGGKRVVAAEQRQQALALLDPQGALRAVQKALESARVALAQMA